MTSHRTEDVKKLDNFSRTHIHITHIIMNIIPFAIDFFITNWDSYSDSALVMETRKFNELYVEKKLWLMIGQLVENDSVNQVCLCLCFPRCFDNEY